VNRSTRCMIVDAPRILLRSRKLVVSTTSVRRPSVPVESPVWNPIDDGNACARSFERLPRVVVIALTNRDRVRLSDLDLDCLWRFGSHGGPEFAAENPAFARGASRGCRTCLPRCIAVARLRLVWRTRPSGGSTTSERCSRCRAEVPTGIVVRRSRPRRRSSARPFAVRNAAVSRNSAASSSRIASFFANLAGRSNGVSCAKSQVPLEIRRGSPPCAELRSLRVFASCAPTVRGTGRDGP